MSPGSRDDLRFEYEQVWAQTRFLMTIQFWVLALVVGFTGAGLIVGLQSGRSLLVATATGLFGLFISVFLWVYNARNGQLLDELIARGKVLERVLGQERGPFRLWPRAWLVYDSGVRIRIARQTALDGIFLVALTAWLFVLMHPALQALLAVRAGSGFATIVTSALAMLMVGGLAAVAIQMKDDRVRWLRRRLQDSVALLMQGDIRRAAMVAAEVAERPPNAVVGQAEAQFAEPLSAPAAVAAAAVLSEVPERWVSAAVDEGRQGRSPASGMSPPITS